ncbi:MAG TPA: permease [Candidatus Methylomirabilis sp.]|nr:permease [Candidatus Methylomirabilis sp.]
MDASFLILLGLTVIALGVAFARDPQLVLRGFQSTARLLGGVWMELALGFVLAGLLDVLIPPPVLSRFMGGDALGRGIVVGWAAGLVMPGGPYLVFPVAANLLRAGAAPGPLIALLTAKTLVSPIRMLTYEAPLLGWPLTLARLLPGVLLPPVLGVLGQWLYTIFARR